MITLQVLVSASSSQAVNSYFVRIKLITHGAVLLLYITCLSYSQETHKGIIKWHESNFDKTLEQSKAENKDIIVFIYAKWCKQCEYMNDNILTIPEIGNFIDSNFIPYKAEDINPETKKIMNKYDVTAFPTFLFIASNAVEIARFVGRAEKTNFLELIKEIKVDRTSISENLIKLKALPGNTQILYTLFSLYIKRRDIGNAENFKSRIKANDTGFYNANEENILSTLADAYFYLKDYPGAIDNTKELIQSGQVKDIKSKYYFIAGCYNKMENYKRALDTYYKILELDPEDNSSYVSIIQQSYIYNIDLDNSINTALKGTLIKATNDQKAELYFELSRAYKKKNNNKKALEMIDNAISLYPMALYKNFKDQITGTAAKNDLKKNEDLLSFSDKAWNFGTVKKDSTVEYIITLENHCGYPAEIQVIKTCDCLSATPETIKLDNEKKIQIKLAYNSSEDDGKIEKYFVIKSDIKGLERTLFTVTGTVEK